MCDVYKSIFVIVVLVWPIDIHVDVVGLVWFEDGQLASQFPEVQPCNLFVELSWQLVN